MQDYTKTDSKELRNRLNQIKKELETASGEEWQILNNEQADIKHEFFRRRTIAGDDDIKDFYEGQNKARFF